MSVRRLATTIVVLALVPQIIPLGYEIFMMGRRQWFKRETAPVEEIRWRHEGATYRLSVETIPFGRQSVQTLITVYIRAHGGKENCVGRVTFSRYVSWLSERGEVLAAQLDPDADKEVLLPGDRLPRAGGCGAPGSWHGGRRGQEALASAAREPCAGPFPEIWYLDFHKGAFRIRPLCTADPKRAEAVREWSRTYGHARMTAIVLHGLAVLLSAWAILAFWLFWIPRRSRKRRL